MTRPGYVEVVHHPLRERILDAAVLVLAEAGMPKTKLLSAVAERAGVSRPTVYRHVGPQTALFEALIRREVERKVVSDLLPALGTLEDPYEDFAKALEALMRLVGDHPVVQFVIRQSPGTVVAQLDNFAPMMAEVVVPLVQPVFDRAAKAGRISPVDVYPIVLWGGRAAVSRLAVPVVRDGVDLRAEVDELFGLGRLVSSLAPPAVA